MPTFFMRTHGQTAGFDEPFTSDMDTALLELTPKLIDLCHRRANSVLKLAAEDESLWEVLFWDEGRISWWEFYPSELIERLGATDAEDAADNDEMVELSDASVLKLDERCAVECAQMRVLVQRQSGSAPVCEFGWGAYRKHSDVWVTTPTFTLSYLEGLLAKIAA